MHNRVTFSLSHSYTWLHIRLRSYVHSRIRTRSHACTACFTPRVRETKRMKKRKEDTLVTLLPLGDERGNARALKDVRAGFRRGENPLSRIGEPRLEIFGLQRPSAHSKCNKSDVKLICMYCWDVQKKNSGKMNRNDCLRSLNVVSQFSFGVSRSPRTCLPTRFYKFLRINTMYLEIKISLFFSLSERYWVKTRESNLWIADARERKLVPPSGVSHS